MVVALFVLTFLLQPLLIPSESMERTLLVGDFLLFNKQVFRARRSAGKWLLPYRPVARGDIIVFHHPQPPMLIKRVVGIPGDHLRIVNGQVFVNGVALRQPYAVFEPAAARSGSRKFSRKDLYRPRVDPEWWRQMESLTHDGELVVPAGEYFVLGDNRNHSLDSRYWGFVPRQAIVARPLVIYFSLVRPSSTDAQPMLRKPRMIDSDTNGNSPNVSRDLRGGAASSAWCIDSLPIGTVESTLNHSSKSEECQRKNASTQRTRQKLSRTRSRTGGRDAV